MIVPSADKSLKRRPRFGEPNHAARPSRLARSIRLRWLGLFIASHTYTAQSSTLSLGTRSNARVFNVTSTAPRRRA